MKRQWFPVVLALGLGCGDDGVGASDTEGDDSTTTATTAPSTTSPSTSTAPSSSGTTMDETGDPDTGTDTGSSTTGGPDPEVDVEVTQYDTQPMVVDVHITTSFAVNDVSLTHTFDEGVVIDGGGDGTEFDFRIRGLAPATLHEIEYDIDGLVDTFDFTTYAPLPGFIGAFPVDPSDIADEAPYRMFDLIPFPAFDTASVFQVDADGTTRWHLGYPSNKMPGPEGVLAAAKVRDDATVMYLQLHEFVIRDELGEIVVNYTDNDLGVTGLHHDVLELPNGNFLAMTHTFDTINYAGFGPTLTAGDGLVEFTPEGEQVWTWDCFDYLDPQRITEPIGPTFYYHPETGEVAYDWTHGNGIVYDADDDIIYMSMRHQDWILAIDHASGDLVWTLGYEGDFTLESGEWFFHQHSHQWQPDGSLLLYDNGIGNPFIAPEDYESHAVRFEIDTGDMTANRVFIDDAEIQSSFAGDADLLPESGRYFVTDSAIFGALGIYSRLREIDPTADPMTQWELLTPDGSFAYRATAQPTIMGMVP